MAVDKGYGSGYKGTGKADRTVGAKGKRTASGAERSRVKDLKSGSLGRPAGSSPFNSIKGKAISFTDLGGVAAAAGLAAAGIAASRTGAGRRVVKAVTPAAPRIAAAASRVASRSANNAYFLRGDAKYLMEDSIRTDRRADSQRNPEYAGTDYYTTQSRMTDPLFDKWEHETTRVGSGESAASAAQRMASQTGRRVTSQRTFDYGMSGVRYRLDPTSEELAMSKRTEASAAQQRRQSYAAENAASNAEYRSNRSNAANEIKRRLAALKLAKKNR